ncbi:MAG TPA: response regulator transcription factor [bacterium]|nr:response regulator transcription factor [bacterium]
MSKVRVLLADDQVLFVESLKTVIEQLAQDIEVVGIARNGQESVRAVETAAPDVVVMDVRMPLMDGVKATAEILARHPAVRIIMLTTFEDDEYVKDALELGAAGYLLKDIPPAELVAAIRAVHGGTILIAPRVAKSLIRKAYTTPEGPAAEPAWMLELSRREREILEKVARGMSNKEIAAELCIAEQTVRNHISVIYDKMGASDRLQAMRMMRDSTKT